jgi:aspartate-semialdehyde dehydrogenase
MSNSTTVEIALVGATGAAGEQILAALGASKLLIRNLRPYGGPSRSPRVDTVELRGQAVGVEPVAALAGATMDIAVLAVPPAVAARVAPALSARGVFVVDVGDATAGVLDAPLVLAGNELSETATRARALRTPSAVGAALGAICAPLVAHGLTGCSTVVSRGASVRGRGGMEELGQQVVAALNNQDPARRMFPDGLAFDTVAEDTAEDEWSNAEALATTELAALTGLDASAFVVQVGVQPLFSGISAGVHLRGVAYDTVEEVLRGAPGLVAITRASRLRPRALLGKPGVGWGRLRTDPAGDGVHVWIVADELASAGAAALWAVEQALAVGLVGVQ